MSETDRQTVRREICSKRCLERTLKKYIMEAELNRVKCVLKCGRPINLDFYAIPVLSLNCNASTYNCIIYHLNIGLSLYRNPFD
jgi:hypothetical protein